VREKARERGKRGTPLKSFLLQDPLLKESSSRRVGKSRLCLRLPQVDSVLDHLGQVPTLCGLEAIKHTATHSATDSALCLDYLEQTLSQTTGFLGHLPGASKHKQQTRIGTGGGRR